jgi:hypothetical protein
MLAIEDNWQADLMILDLYSKDNSGLLIFIDTFSKFFWVRKLKSKSADSVARAMNDILTSSNRKCNLLHTDFGTEFYNSTFKELTLQYSVVC